MGVKWNIYVKYNFGIYYIRQGSKAGLRLVVKSVLPVISQSRGIWQLILCSGRFKRKTLPLYTNLILSLPLTRCINKIILNSMFKFCVLIKDMKWNIYLLSDTKGEAGTFTVLSPTEPKYINTVSMIEVPQQYHLWTIFYEWVTKQCNVHVY